MPLGTDREGGKMKGFGKWDTTPPAKYPCQACGVPAAHRQRRFGKEYKFSGQFVCRVCIHKAGECNKVFPATRCDAYCKEA